MLDFLITALTSSSMDYHDQSMIAGLALGGDGTPAAR